ncbi:MAG TPA: hypothetical protein VFY34_11595 [Pyrinomonadaceae bacterium]|nr:hypothetical protein [Pyrinomonadaceae bacterium]
MPLILRRFRGPASGALAEATLPPANWPASPKLVPRRNPQLRQNRNSDGIGEWQLEQVTIVGPDDNGISGFCDITNVILWV